MRVTVRLCMKVMVALRHHSVLSHASYLNQLACLSQLSNKRQGCLEDNLVVCRLMVERASVRAFASPSLLTVPLLTVHRLLAGRALISFFVVVVEKAEQGSRFLISIKNKIGEYELNRPQLTREMRGYVPKEKIAPTGIKALRKMAGTPYLEICFLIASGALYRKSSPKDSRAL